MVEERICSRKEKENGCGQVLNSIKRSKLISRKTKTNLQNTAEVYTSVYM